MGSWWWYLSRSSGFVAWLTSAASIGFGLALAGRWRGRPSPAWVLAMHRWLAGLTLGLLVVHLGALAADSYVQFSVTDLLVPFTSGYRTGAVALGVLALWGLVAVEVTSLLRRRLSRRAWRAVHLTSYLTFVMATWHSVATGTDAGQRWFGVITGCVAGAIAALTVVRVLQQRGPAPVPSGPTAGSLRPTGRG